MRKDITITGELRDRHDLERVHTKLSQPAQTGDYGVESAFGRKRADMQLVDDVVTQSRCSPCAVRPLERVVVDCGGAVNAVGLVARCRIG